jgi:hypothetical protein
MAFKHLFLVAILITVVSLAGLTYNDALKNSDLAQKYISALPKEYTINQTDIEFRQQTANIPDGSPEYYSVLKTTSEYRIFFCILSVASIASFMVCFIMIDRMDDRISPRARHMLQYRSNSDELLARVLAHHMEQQLRESTRRIPQPIDPFPLNTIRDPPPSEPPASPEKSPAKEPPRSRWDEVEP